MSYWIKALVEKGMSSDERVITVRSGTRIESHFVPAAEVDEDRQQVRVTLGWTLGSDMVFIVLPTSDSDTVLVQRSAVEERDEVSPTQ